jgi:hypothetical protein
MVMEKITQKRQFNSRDVHDARCLRFSFLKKPDGPEQTSAGTSMAEATAVEASKRARPAESGAVGFPG